MNIMNQEIKAPREITGRMVLVGFILFFGTIIAVNGVLMYFALNTWPGLVTDDAYIKGLRYNDTLAASESQRLLDWDIRVALSNDKKLTIHVNDHNDAPIRDLEIEAALTRPLGEHNIVILTMREIQPGIYESEFIAPKSGRWNADIKAISTTGAIFKSRYKMMVK